MYLYLFLMCYICMLHAEGHVLALCKPLCLQILDFNYVNIFICKIANICY